MQRVFWVSTRCQLAMRDLVRMILEERSRAAGGVSVVEAFRAKVLAGQPDDWACCTRRTAGDPSRHGPVVVVPPQEALSSSLLDELDSRLTSIGVSLFFAYSLSEAEVLAGLLSAIAAHGGI